MSIRKGAFKNLLFVRKVLPKTAKGDNFFRDDLPKSMKIFTKSKKNNYVHKQKLHSKRQKRYSLRKEIDFDIKEDEEEELIFISPEEKEDIDRTCFGDYPNLLAFIDFYLGEQHNIQKIMSITWNHRIDAFLAHSLARGNSEKFFESIRRTDMYKNRFCELLR